MSGSHRVVRAWPPSRLATAVLLTALAICLFAFLSFWQSVEAAEASYLYGVGAPTSFNFSRAVVFFGLGRSNGYGLRITPECCSALLIAPAALLSALLTVRQRVPVRRILGGFGAATLLLLLSNQVRLGVIAWSIGEFGLTKGFEWGHAVIGSVVSLVFAAGSLAILAWVALGGRNNQPRETM
jgi:exosortase/archaeosortase family protein